MNTYLITSIDVQSYNRDIRMHVDLSRELDKCPDKHIAVVKNTAPIVRTINDSKRDWLVNAEDKWLDTVNTWFSDIFSEPFVFIKLNKKRLNKDE